MNDYLHDPPDALSARDRVTRVVQGVTRFGQISRRNTAIDALRAELETERKWLDRLEGGSYATDCYDRALELLDEAAEALTRDDPISSRRAAYAAQRMAVLGLIDLEVSTGERDRAESGDDDGPRRTVSDTVTATPSQLSAYRAALLRKKALGLYVHADERLDGRRREVFDGLLTIDGDLKADVDPVDLAAAVQVVEEYYFARDLIYGKLKRQLNYFVAFASFTVAVLLASALGGVFGPVLGDATEVAKNQFLVYVVLFGVLGASMHAIFSLSGRFVRGEVVETRELVDFPMALARVVAGGVSALVLFVVLQSGIFTFEFGAGLALSLALAAGYSEELVRSALESVSGRVVDGDERSRV